MNKKADQYLIGFFLSMTCLDNQEKPWVSPIRSQFCGSERMGLDRSNFPFSNRIR